MVVEQHLAGTGDARKGEDAVHRAPRDRAGGNDDPVAVAFRDKGYLAPLRRLDLLGEVGDDSRCNAFHGHGVMT